MKAVITFSRRRKQLSIFQNAHDLKSENVLVGEDDVAKIADFGLATGTGGSTMLTKPMASRPQTVVSRAAPRTD